MSTEMMLEVLKLHVLQKIVFNMGVQRSFQCIGPVSETSQSDSDRISHLMRCKHQTFL